MKLITIYFIKNSLCTGQFFFEPEPGGSGVQPDCFKIVSYHFIVPIGAVPLLAPVLGLEKNCPVQRKNFFLCTLLLPSRRLWVFTA